jgi:hypothetical protein
MRINICAISYRHLQVVFCGLTVLAKARADSPRSDSISLPPHSSLRLSYLLSSCKFCFWPAEIRGYAAPRGE